jgi:hypothetical protein
MCGEGQRNGEALYPMETRFPRMRADAVLVRKGGLYPETKPGMKPGGFLMYRKIWKFRMVFKTFSVSFKLFFLGSPMLGVCLWWGIV